MADKLVELKASLEGMSDDALKLILRFAEFLVEEGKKLNMKHHPGGYKVTNERGRGKTQNLQSAHHQP